MTPLRIAVANWTGRVAGGAESYLRDLLPVLLDRGHALALLVERDAPPDRPRIAPAPVVVWDAARRADALTSVRAWQPDVMFVHDLNDPRLESALLGMAPAVRFVHAYHGTCISGEKTHKFPTRRPCHRVFGPPCLALYYPRRCGGLSPVTMARDYRRQGARLRRLRRYARLITASAHMRDEYARHGFPPSRVSHLPIPAPEASPLPVTPTSAGLPHRLVWAGRMEQLKGGDLFLDAAAAAARRLDRRLVATLLGDGRARQAWEARGRALRAAGAPLEVTFAGWTTDEEVGLAFARADLLVVSSVWPEPFGRVGLEAGRFAVPAAAYAVGGIPEWLSHGVNGHLAPGDPPTPDGLAGAIVACLRDPAAHQRLRAGARAAAARWRFADHAASLEGLFHDVLTHG